MMIDTVDLLLRWHDRQQQGTPEFKAMVTKRWIVSVVLTIVLFVVYYDYIVLIAVDKTSMAQKIGEVTTLGTLTSSAIAFFLIIVSITLVITYWAAKRTRSTKEFYAAVAQPYGQAALEPGGLVSNGLDAVSLGIALLLGIVFKGQNVAYVVGLAFALACSANFPALLLSIVWRTFTTAGAVASILTGSILTVLLIILSPTIQVDVLKHPDAYFPLRNPAIVSMTAAFVVAIVVSLITREERAETMVDDEKLRMYLGIGAE